MLLAGCVYVHQEMKALRKECDERIRESAASLSADISRGELALDGERAARREADLRLERMIEGFSGISSAVLLMGKSVEHLAERFNDHKTHTDKGVDEVKHTLRNIDQKINAIGARSSRTPSASKGTK